MRRRQRIVSVGMGDRQLGIRSGNKVPQMRWRAPAAVELIPFFSDGVGLR